MGAHHSMVALVATHVSFGGHKCSGCFMEYIVGVWQVKAMWFLFSCMIFWGIVCSCSGGIFIGCCGAAGEAICEDLDSGNFSLQHFTACAVAIACAVARFGFTLGQSFAFDKLCLLVHGQNTD